MITDEGKIYSETYIVWNDFINLIGTLMPSNDGKAAVCGTIKFQNGKQLSFSSKSDDSEILNEKLMSICRSIAKFYGTNVIRRKYRVVSSGNETSVPLDKDQHLQN